jgi:hypothetical protein
VEAAAALDDVKAASAEVDHNAAAMLPVLELGLPEVVDAQLDVA